MIKKKVTLFIVDKDAWESLVESKEIVSPSKLTNCSFASIISFVDMDVFFKSLIKVSWRVTYYQKKKKEIIFLFYHHWKKKKENKLYHQHL